MNKDIKMDINYEIPCTCRRCNDDSDHDEEDGCELDNLRCEINYLRNEITEIRFYLLFKWVKSDIIDKKELLSQIELVENRIDKARAIIDKLLDAKLKESVDNTCAMLRKKYGYNFQ